MAPDCLPAVGALGLDLNAFGDARLAVEFGAVGAEGGGGCLAVADLASQELLELEVLLEFVWRFAEFHF